MSISKLDFLKFQADSSHILSQRNAEICAHGPILEQDIAITNITLDLLGQARNFYQYAATLSGDPVVTEDSLAYLRNEREYKNLLLVELPAADWSYTVLRQLFYSAYQYLIFEQLEKNTDLQIAAIATKSLKETTYHIKWSSEWVIRLGDGTEESHSRIKKALVDYWPYTGELFIPAPYETETLLGFDLSALKYGWLKQISAVFEEAKLSIPENIFMQTGGKTGVHTEHLGFLLAEMQHLQRSHPGAIW